MTPQFLNKLLTTVDIDNYKKAFQILFSKKELLKDVYPMIFWVLRNIQNSPFSIATQLDLKDELIKFKEITEKLDNRFKDKLNDCNKALDLFYSDIGWDNANRIEDALDAFEPYRVSYEALLKENLIQPYLFIIKKGWDVNANGLYPYFKYLIEYNALDIKGKEIFWEVLNNLDEDEVYSSEKNILFSLKFMGDMIQLFPENTAEYYKNKGWLYDFYLKDEPLAKKMYLASIEFREKVYNNNNEDIENLEELIDDLIEYTERWEDAYKYVGIAEKLAPENLKIILLKAQIEKDYYKNIEIAKSLYYKVIKKDKEDGFYMELAKGSLNRLNEN